MAERSKALVSGTSLFGGVGSNPTSVIILLSGLVDGSMSRVPRLPISRLAQLVERKTLNLVVGGSSPPVGISLYMY